MYITSPLPPVLSLCTCLPVCLSIRLSVHPAQPGLAPLLSLLLCVVPSKVVHLTYEPAWPLPPGEPPAPASTPSPSFSRQVNGSKEGPPTLPPPSLPHSACGLEQASSRL